jgi:hypothetical protein
MSSLAIANAIRTLYSSIVFPVLQVQANGYVAMNKLNLLAGLAVGAGVTVASPGVIVTSGGMTIASGTLNIDGNSAVAAGAMSVASAAALSGVLDVKSTVATNLLRGTLTSGATGNLISLLSGATTLFRVMSVDVFRRTVGYPRFGPIKTNYYVFL